MLFLAKNHVFAKSMKKMFLQGLRELQGLINTF